MNLQDLRIFILCTRYLSFTKVAELMYTSQSSISKAISTLEYEVGGPLFLRSSRKMELTALGAALLPRAEALISKEEELKAFLHQYHEGLAVSPIVVGIARYLTGSPIDGILLPLMDGISHLRNLHKDLDVKIAYFDDQDLKNRLDSGQIDLAIIAVNDSHLKALSFFQTDFIRLNTVNNYLIYCDRADTPRTIEEVMNDMDCLYSVEDQIAVSISCDFLRAMKRPLRMETCDNWSEVVLKVKNGQGCTVLGATTAEMGVRCGLKAASLKEYSLTTSLLALWKHGKDPILEEMAVLLRNSFMELGIPPIERE